MNNSKVLDFFKPFDCHDHLLKSLFIFNNFSAYSIDTLTKIINTTTGCSKTNLEILNLKIKTANFPELYGNRFFLEENFKEKINCLIDSDINCKQFCTLANCCSFCDSKLSGNTRCSKSVCFYFSDGPKPALMHIKQCDNCQALHYLNYAEKDSVRKLYQDVLESKYVAFTHETIFEIKLLNSFTSELVTNHTSFIGFTNSYNLLHNCKQIYIDQMAQKKERFCLNEVRLADGWFYLKYLSVSVELNKELPYPAPSMANLNKDIKYVLKPNLSNYFIKKWSGKFLKQ